MEDSPVEQQPVEAQPVEPSVPEAQPEPQLDPSVSVPGSQPDRHPDEGAQPQPDAPNPVPATANPVLDAVETNGHLYAVANALEDAAHHMDVFLHEHPLNQEIHDAVRALVEKLHNAVI